MVKVISNYREFDGDFDDINFILQLLQKEEEKLKKFIWKKLEFYKNLKVQKFARCFLNKFRELK